MKCDSWASFLARTFTSPSLGRKPKVRIATLDEYDFDIVHKASRVNQNANGLNQNPSSNEEDITCVRWHGEVDLEVVLGWYTSTYLCILL
jgi:hypothetical protein